MAQDRRAHSVLFGFDFQVNAAIILMLDNIKELSSLRLEGNFEDIEITLDNKQKILAQAKAIENSSSDFSHVKENLKKALLSLSEGNQKANACQLILITNSPDPFHDKNSRSIFWGLPTRREFASLPPSSKEIIENYLSKIPSALNPEKFSIQVFPFETDDDKERYKAVLAEVNDFIGTLGSGFSPGIGKKLLAIWHDQIFVNGTKKDAAIELSKNDVIWPIMVLETDINQCDANYLEQFDIGVYDEVVHLYGGLIDCCCERIDFFTKVLYDFNEFDSSKKPIEKCQDFIDATWMNYKGTFATQNMEPELLEALTKIVLYNIIRRRFVIDRIKRGVNL